MMFAKKIRSKDDGTFETFMAIRLKSISLAPKDEWKNLNNFTGILVDRQMDILRGIHEMDADFSLDLRYIKNRNTKQGIEICYLIKVLSRDQDTAKYDAEQTGGEILRLLALEAGEHPARNRWILHQISLLYRIESRLRKAKTGPALRAAVRAWQSRPILDRLFLVFEKMLQSGKYKPKTITGTAIAYALRQRDGLQVYVKQGQVEIDNNLIENAIRPAALGRKNWLFIGDEDAGWRSAVIYSILQSCKTYGIDPYAYLKDVLERLPHMTIQEIDQITPSAWSKAQSLKRAS